MESFPRAWLTMVYLAISYTFAWSTLRRLRAAEQRHRAEEQRRREEREEKERQDKREQEEKAKMLDCNSDLYYLVLSCIILCCIVVYCNAVYDIVSQSWFGLLWVWQIWLWGWIGFSCFSYNHVIISFVYSCWLLQFLVCCSFLSLINSHIVLSCLIISSYFFIFDHICFYFL